ncbi:MAG: MgtC/SapB family protein [Hydrogenophaga sp.]|uniref:MgtC/SapB family protein n=1 Tax=Hydrogenophaga sp. TaxID=1904254 RepID=UPI001D4B171E|nr:MgtC/SapB family protein [Hydrogenophaga sp.]MBX3609321.1 MgtC/SapB family protein [Hydrogenophaga sp.]
MNELASPDITRAATVLAVALGCGLLVGVERERRKGSGPGRALAGLRSFALTCVTGAAAALTGLAGVVVAGAAFVAGLAVVAYAKDRSNDPGVTTEVALLLTYLIGVLAAHSTALAAGLAVVLTVVLFLRERAHRAVTQWLRPSEMRDGLLLAALVLLGLPLLPDVPLWGDALNPRGIGQLLALLLTLQSVAHLGRRLLAAQHALALSSLASGFVSSTATIASLGLAARQGKAPARVLAGGGLLSCVSTLLQLVVVASAVRPAWLAALWLPVSVSALIALLWGGWLVRGDGASVAVSGATPRAEALPAAHEDRMFSLGGALMVAGLLVGIQALVHGLQQWMGDAGLTVAVALGSLADLHASAAAVFADAAPSPVARHALALALGLHAASKSITAYVAGRGAYLRWLAPGLWVHTALAMAWLVLG